MQIGIGDGILSRAATNGRWIGDLVLAEMMDCLCINLWHWGWVGLAWRRSVLGVMGQLALEL